MSKTATICFTCLQQCGHIAHIQDGQVTRLEGDKKHPRTAGFICSKGASSHELHYSKDRIHHPLKRIGPRGAGKWERISWDQALDEIAEKLAQLAKTHGAETLAHCFGTIRGSDYSIGKRFMNIFGSPNTIGQDKICLGPTTLGEFLTYGFGPTTSALPEAGVTGCLVLWGKRPSQSAGPAWQAMQRAIRTGTKMIVIDPEETGETEKADLWLRVKPGGDAPLGIGLLKALIADGLYDPDFVKTQTTGFEQLADLTANHEWSEIEVKSGVSVEKIRKAARLIGDNTPVLFAGGNGLCQSGTPSVQQGRIIACLIAICGSLNKAGGHMLYGPPQDILANGDWMANDMLPAEQRCKALGHDTYASFGFGYDKLDQAIAKAWYGKLGIADWISGSHAPSLWQAIATQNPYPVTALILQNHNPLGAAANFARVEASLLSANLDLLVCHDLFVNATTRYADYLLPAAHWLEKPYFSVGGAYLGIVGDYVEANHAAIPPQYEHRSDYDFWRDLGHRCGQSKHWADTAEAFYDSLLAPAGLNFDQVAQHYGPLSGSDARHPDNAIPQTVNGFGTPSGKVELFSSLLDDWGQDPLPTMIDPTIKSYGIDYPLTLITGGRDISGFHQSAQQTPAFRRKHSHPFVRMSPETAQIFDIKEGSWIEVSTPIGRSEQICKFTNTLPINVIHADRWWYPEGTSDQTDPFGARRTSINQCTSDHPDDCDPVMGSWLMRGLPCRITAISETGCS